MLYVHSVVYLKCQHNSEYCTRVYTASISDRAFLTTKYEYIMKKMSHYSAYKTAQGCLIMAIVFDIRFYIVYSNTSSSYMYHPRPQLSCPVSLFRI